VKDHDRKFDISSYHGILLEAIELGFAFQTFSEYLDAPLEKVILIRHDVDISLEWALEMSRVEYELGIRTTYFIRVHSTRYNLFDRYNYRRLHELKDKGFEIGVHQEVCNFAETADEAFLLLKREKKVIESILGCEVRGVATHLPKHNFIKITPEVMEKVGFLYEPGSEIFNKNALFVSDSNNHWKKYTFREAIRRSDKVLANIHPVWWIGSINSPESIINFLKEGN
jgi:hypothetical protein